MPQVDEILRHMRELDASEMHIATGAPVTFRIHGDLVPANDRVLSSGEVELLLYEIIGNEQIEHFEQNWDLDTAYTIEGYARFRVSMFRDQRGPGGVLRIIPEEPPTLEELGFSDVVTRLAESQRGLTPVTGPTNSGKPTTLAAMINHLNEMTAKHTQLVEEGDITPDTVMAASSNPSALLGTTDKTRIPEPVA